MSCKAKKNPTENLIFAEIAEFITTIFTKKQPVEGTKKTVPIFFIAHLFLFAHLT